MTTSALVLVDMSHSVERIRLFSNSVASSRLYASLFPLFPVQSNMTPPVFEDSLTVLTEDVPCVTADNANRSEAASCRIMRPSRMEESFRVTAMRMFLRDRCPYRLALILYIPSLTGVAAIRFSISNRCFNISASQQLIRE
jgi:hypothetical protein